MIVKAESAFRGAFHPQHATEEAAMTLQDPGRVTTPTSETDHPNRAINWVAYGLDPNWVRENVEPFCSRYDTQLYQAEAIESIEQLMEEDPDWDILFLGFESEISGDTPEEFIRVLNVNHPSEEIVVVAAEPTLERQVRFYQAGASQVLSRYESAETIDRVLKQAIERINLRHHRNEQEKLRLVNQLAISVNHEINNPLTGLMGTTELMLMESKKFDEKTRRDLDTIVAQCRRIQEVTARLKMLNHLRTVPYGTHDEMIDLVGASEPPEVEPTEAVAEAFLPTPSVLAVDDNPLIIDLIVRMFESRYRIDSAPSASDALKLMSKNEYDLVLIDLILPEMNGLELFRAIREMRPDQKALLTTAYQGDARVEQAVVEGAIGCVYKPFQLEALEEAIDRAIGQSRPGAGAGDGLRA